MSLFSVFAVLISLTALFSFINERYIKLPTTIGVMVASLASSILIILLGSLGFGSIDWARGLVERVDFDALLMKGMLSFLLFAGALNIDLRDLLKHKWSISYLVTIGMVVSTLLTGLAIWWIFVLFGYELSFAYALLLGALISPTDAVAVLGILKRTKVSKTLKTIITGESLFNDAVAVVLFLAIMGMALGGQSIRSFHIGEFFLKEAIGGVLLGLILGYISYNLINKMDNYIVIVLITLAVVSGGYALADSLDISGPLSMVIAGLFLSYRRSNFTHSEKTHETVRSFWELIDEILNAVLFVLIGLEILILHIEGPFIVAGIIAIPVIIFIRSLSVGLPVVIFQIIKTVKPFDALIMTWGGLRGGVSIALALSVPDSSERDLILVVTYVVVVFSILVQGLSLGKLVSWAESRK
jgi:monovalent cation:H+ antiporter, CPA1 family